MTPINFFLFFSFLFSSRIIAVCFKLFAFAFLGVIFLLFFFSVSVAVIHGENTLFSECSRSIERVTDGAKIQNVVCVCDPG